MRSRLRGEQSLGDRATRAAEERVQPCRLGQVDPDLDDAPRTSSAHTHRRLRIEGDGSLRHGRAWARRRRQCRSRRIGRGDGRARGGAARRRGRGAGKRRQGHRHGNDRHGCRHATRDREAVLGCRRCAARESAREEKACGKDAGAGADPRRGGESVPNGSETVRGQSGASSFVLGAADACQHRQLSPAPSSLRRGSPRNSF